MTKKSWTILAYEREKSTPSIQRKVESEGKAYQSVFDIKAQTNDMIIYVVCSMRPPLYMNPSDDPSIRVKYDTYAEEW